MLLVGTRAGACSAHVRFSIDIGTRITVVVGRVHWLSCCWVSALGMSQSAVCIYFSVTRADDRSTCALPIVESTRIEILLHEHD